jgi:glycerol-3-phosphate dehydrogenase
MPKIVETDIAIIGGGIAGLWLLNRLRNLDYAAILLESGTLGGGQTHKAQGIIHGGTKYSLQGNVTAAAQAIADMPGIWQQCLVGKGEIDLSGVPVLSQHQYLFSTNKLTGKLAGFFAGLALQGRVQALAPEAYPEVFQNVKFKGLVYALDEMAIDTQALVRELVKPNQDVIYKIDPLRADQLTFDEENNLLSMQVQACSSEPVLIKAKKYIFAAGAGNELLQHKLQLSTIAMQRRPLHMVVVKTEFDFPVFAHCLGIGATPRITITTHKAQDGKSVWYIGGQIAEEGVKLDSDTQIALTKKELQEIFTWLDFSNAQFASFYVDRAEPLQPEGKRPDGVFMKEIGNIIIAWPTKLALAPKLADEIIDCIKAGDTHNGTFDARALRAFPMPVLAAPVWDELLC